MPWLFYTTTFPLVLQLHLDLRAPLYHSTIMWVNLFNTSAVPGSLYNTATFGCMLVTQLRCDLIRYTNACQDFTHFSVCSRRKNNTMCALVCGLHIIWPPCAGFEYIFIFFRMLRCWFIYIYNLRWPYQFVSPIHIKLTPCWSRQTCFKVFSLYI